MISLNTASISSSDVTALAVILKSFKKILSDFFALSLCPLNLTWNRKQQEK